MVFQPGNNANPTGRPKSKPLTDALRLIASQPFQLGQRIRLPKSPTVIQKIAAVLLQKAVDGDPTSIAEVGNRLEGRPSQAIDLTTKLTLEELVLASYSKQIVLEDSPPPEEIKTIEHQPQQIVVDSSRPQWSKSKRQKDNN